MIIVVDTNILISTLMKADGAIGTFLLRDLHAHQKLSCYQKLHRGLKAKGFERVATLDELKEWLK